MRIFHLLPFCFGQQHDGFNVISPGLTAAFRSPLYSLNDGSWPPEEELSSFLNPFPRAKHLKRLAHLVAEISGMPMAAVVCRNSTSERVATTYGSSPKSNREFAQESSDLDREYEGLGIGLAVARNLVETMCGSISVESAKGAGTTFHIELPR